MQLSAAIAPLWEFRFAFTYGILPTLAYILKSPLTALTNGPHALAKFYFSRVWLAFGPGSDERSREVKVDLLASARGTVLEIGAGHGRTMFYLPRDKVSKYVALEPNVEMHSVIREHAQKAGYDESRGKLVILAYGAGEVDLILSALNGEQVDTLVSIITLCSVPNARRVLSDLVNRALKPGGQLLFYEHVLSHRADVQWWQRAWAPLWALFFDGCRLDQPTDLWVKAIGGWDEERSKQWGKKGEPEENVWWHQTGRFTKLVA